MKYIPKIIIFGCIIWFFVVSFDLTTYRAKHQINEPGLAGYAFISGETQLRISPGDEDWMIEKIHNTKNRLWLAVYTFTLPSLREALLEAKNRGVDVQVILEQFPYERASMNRDTINFFDKNSIRYHLSGPSQFAFMHAKYALFDEGWMVATANWTRSSYSQNREFFVNGTHEEILHELEKIFTRDFAGGRGDSSIPGLIAGPTNTRKRLQSFIEPTNNILEIYAPSFTDSGLLSSLTQLCTNNRIIRILLDKNSDNHAAYNACLQVRLMKKPLHAKAIIRDGDAVFVGSFNYTKNSLENNREIGVFVDGEIAKQIRETFVSDWKSSLPLK